MSICLAILLSIFRIVVIPAQFSDKEFVCTPQELHAKLGETRTYFNEQFAGEKEFQIDLGPVVTLSRPMSYYGANYPDRKDVLLHEAVREACLLSDSQLEFSENVVILFAGMSEADGASADHIWPQQAKLSDYGKTLTLDGKTIDSYSVATELSSDNGENPRPSGIGPLCHELAHGFGLYDLYDTDGDSSGGESKGLWDTALMDRGSRNNSGNTPPHFNALDLDLLEIGKCDTLTVGSYKLEPINKSKRYLKALTGTEGEYFLIECRENTGRDAYIGGSGMLIYHIDRSSNNAGYSDILGRELTAAERWSLSQINNRPDRECARIITAIPDASNAQEIFFPQPGHDSFGSDTSPAFRAWDGSSFELALTEIKKNSDGSVSFEVIRPIEIIHSEIFQDAMILQWQISESFKSILGYEIEWTDGEQVWNESIDSSARSYTITGLRPQKAYKFKLTLRASEQNQYSCGQNFITKYYRDDTYPYIYLNSTERKADGRFVLGSKIPLRVFNARGVHEVKWYFNNKPISAGKDGYYTVTSEGTLKAEISYRDGESEIIIKKIQL